jgi:hypothetical protein
MAYALIHDVPASWERYDAVARLFGRAPQGLLVHVAGPTDEGFRIVDVWTSEAAWRAFEPDFGAALWSIDPTVRPKTVVRELVAAHEVVGGQHQTS